MPATVRENSKATRISLNILGEPSQGLVDSFGKKKRFVKKKEKRYEEGERTNRFEDIGYR